MARDQYPGSVLVARGAGGSFYSVKSDFTLPHVIDSADLEPHAASGGLMKLPRSET